MWGGVRRPASWVAILAIALHTVLWGLSTPFAVASTVDPFTVICHSGAPLATDQAPANPASLPGAACDHCSLCSAVAPPPLTLDNVLTGTLMPVKLLRIVPPRPALPRDDVAANPRLPQGPPSKA